MSKTVLPWVALNAATATGASASVDLQGVSREFTLATFLTGSPTSCFVKLELSHDGTNWFYGGISTEVANSVAGSQYFSNGLNGSGNVPPNTMAYLPYARYVRVNLTTLSGGTAPTVTTTIAVGEIL